jgi:phosphoglycolate phosphatase-like HAD superfamily hydrolase
LQGDPVCSGAKADYTGGVIRNVIFDWSGTLVDDLPAVWKATNYVLAQADRAELTLEQFRAEFFNAFNHANLSNPVSSISSPTVGQILSTSSPRILQFGLGCPFSFFTLD